MEIDKTINLKANYIVTKVGLYEIPGLLAKYLKISAEEAMNFFTMENWEKVRLQATKDDNFRKQHLEQFETHNLVPLAIRSSLAKLISGTVVSPSFIANIVALGNSSIAPTILDTQLGDETKRSTFTNREARDNVAYLDKFRSPVEVAGNTYLEAGVFVDGDPMVPDSGYLLSRINMDETMAINETLTINVSITVA